MEKTTPILNHSSPKCPYCHDAVTADSLKTACESCMAWHHRDCWEEHGACSTCHQVRDRDRASGSNSERGGRKVCDQAGCTEFAVNREEMGALAKLCTDHGVSRAKRSETLMLGLTLAAFFYGLIYLMMAFGEGEIDSGVPMAIACGVVASIWGSILLWQRRFHRMHLKGMTSKKALK